MNDFDGARSFFLKEMYSQFKPLIHPKGSLSHYFYFFVELDDYLNNPEWVRFKGEQEIRQSIFDTYYADIIENGSEQ